jgi:hypothetical protein
LLERCFCLVDAVVGPCWRGGFALLERWLALVESAIQASNPGGAAARGKGGYRPQKQRSQAAHHRMGAYRQAVENILPIPNLSICGGGDGQARQEHGGDLGRRYPAACDRDEGNLHPAFCTQPMADLLDVILDRPWPDAQAAGYLLSGQTAGDEASDLELAGRELWRFGLHDRHISRSESGSTEYL